MAYRTAKQKQHGQAAERLAKTLQELETATVGLLQRQHEVLWESQPLELLDQANALASHALEMPWRSILAGLEGDQWEHGRQQLQAAKRAAIEARNAQAIPVLTGIWNDSSDQPQEERERRIVEALLSFPSDSHLDLPPVAPLHHMNDKTWGALTIRYLLDGCLELDAWVESRAHLRDQIEANGGHWQMPDLT